MTALTRVNLSLPEPMDTLLTRLAELSGRSKASWVMEAIEYQLPTWRRRLRALEGHLPELRGETPSEPVQELQQDFQPQASHMGGKLTRQQRRALERQEAKDKARGLDAQ